MLRAGIHVAGPDYHHVALVYGELDGDAGLALDRLAYAGQQETPDRGVVRGPFRLALEHVQLDRALEVLYRGEYAAADGGQGLVLLYQRDEGAAVYLEAEGTRADVGEGQAPQAALYPRGLDGRPERHDLLRVDPGVGLAPEELGEPALGEGSYNFV